MQDILINWAPQETRVAIVENGAVQELHVERALERGLVGNIYAGKVVRVLPGMQSAFIDIGLERAAFLHVADVQVNGVTPRGAAGNAPRSEHTAALQMPIERLVFEGQTLTVQVIKDPIGTKGARLSTQISIAGRLLVFLPQDEHIGISQKIGSPELREQLRARMNVLVQAGEGEPAPPSSLPTSACMRARSCSRSSGEPIFCEMPMCSSCGRKTSSRPAIEIWVDSRAPLVPIGSLITCTVSVWPSKTIRSIGGGTPLPCSARAVPPLT